MPDLIPIIDEQGNERRLGSLAPPPNFVSAFPELTSAVVPWAETDIRKALADVNRLLGRKLFGVQWLIDQHSKGSCNGHASGSMLAKARWLGGLTDGLILSGAFPYSLMNGHQDHGSALEDALRVIQENGDCRIELATWDEIYPELQDPQAKADAAKRKGFSCYSIGNQCSEAEFRAKLNTALAAGYLVGVAVHVSSKFQRLNSQGIAGVDNGPGNHAVHLDDMIWNGSEYLYDMANSWGPSYGEQGRAWLRWSHFAQTWKVHTFYAVPPFTVENP